MRINKKAFLFVLVMAVICTMLGAAAEASPAENAIRAAAKNNRYVFVTFYKNNDSASKKMLADMKSVKGKYAKRGDFVSVDVAGKANRKLVSEYGADRSQIPLTIAVAPNGAVTAGYPGQINKSKLPSAFVSNGTAAVLKVMQKRKLAAVCLQSSKTKHNKECLATARGIKSDSRFGGAMEIVKIDPSDRSESKLLKQLKINGKSANAQLVVLAPPGRIVGKFDGAAKKDTVVASLTKSLSGGCSGGSCGPGGCGN